MARLAGATQTEPTLAARRAAVQRMAELVLTPIGGLMPLEWRNEWELLDDHQEQRTENKEQKGST